MDITALDVQYEDVQNNGAGPPELTVTDSSPMAAEARVLGRDSPDAAPVVESSDPVEVFGYLQKQGRRLKGWHQRWFEIRGQHMYYFKNNTKKQCLGEIQLSICTQVQPIDVATFGHPFEVVTKERTHTLASRTEEDMEKWITSIRKNMGPRPGPSQKKINKVKKWDSFKNAFHIRRERSASPQPLPTESLPANTKTEVNRNKSILNKFRRVKRERSNSSEKRTAELREEEKAARPLSENVSYSQKTPHLVAALVDPPTAVSVPNSPLSRRRQQSGPVHGKRESLSPAPLSQTPGSSSGGATPRSTPERAIEQEPSPPKHTSTPMPAGTAVSPSPSPPKVTFATPRPLVSDASKISPPHLAKKKHPTPPSPLVSEESTLPEILTRPLAWDEVKVVLDSMEDSEPLFPEFLPPQDEPWAERESPIEQLRQFLAVCP